MDEDEGLDCPEVRSNADRRDIGTNGSFNNIKRNDGAGFFAW